MSEPEPARAPAAYSHLYRYARAWLDQHRPPRPPAKRRAPRVDWPARDREVAALVSEAAAAMLALPSRPVRLTRAALTRRAGHASLIEQHLDRLPLVAEVLAAKEESRVAHGARKVRWGAEQLAAEGAAVEAWTLERRAALRPDLAAQLADVIEDAGRRGRAV